MMIRRILAHQRTGQPKTTTFAYRKFSNQTVPKEAKYGIFHHPKNLAAIHPGDNQIRTAWVLDHFRAFPPDDGTSIETTRLIGAYQTLSYARRAAMVEMVRLPLKLFGRSIVFDSLTFDGQLKSWHNRLSKQKWRGPEMFDMDVRTLCRELFILTNKYTDDQISKWCQEAMDVHAEPPQNWMKTSVDYYRLTETPFYT